MKVAVGNIKDMRRPPRRAVCATSWFASWKRAISCGSRTNARTTRIPESCSRKISLIRSMRTCMTRNVGTILETTVPRMIMTSGTAMTMIHDKLTSCCRASTSPPMAVNGAATSRVQVVSTNICTCCTSLVIRVINEGAPK